MRWYLLVLIVLFDGVHLKAAIAANKDIRWLEKRATNSFTSAQRQFQQQMLNAHNSYRSCHGVKSLTLDDTISQSAQSYANQLAATKTFAHSGNEDYGENLYMESSSAPIKNVDGSAASAAWYQEISSYNFQEAQFSSSSGHFTQVVWKDSQQLGCGFALTADGLSVYVVCQYSPPGNYEDDFAANVLQPKHKC